MTVHENGKGMSDKARSKFDCGRWYHVYCIQLAKLDENFLCSFCAGMRLTPISPPPSLSHNHIPTLPHKDYCSFQPPSTLYWFTVWPCLSCIGDWVSLDTSLCTFLKTIDILKIYSHSSSNRMQIFPRLMLWYETCTVCTMSCLVSIIRLLIFLVIFTWKSCSLSCK